MEQIKFICLILFLGVSYGKQNNSSVCPTFDNPEQCCSGSRIINRTCTECVGFFGPNSVTPCPVNFYGVKCDSECNCTEEEECNPYVGCLNVMYTRNDT
ncbi:N-acetylglucosamine-1-phosphodiester alpha-N-acetylglucosaminidase-like isoform X2 [Saccostrea cucullata]|uniref:N-acetylglucosamine-1-phosphodiester alpha-N-acetylglucosaminidase-like isoform X2 n=1 Tax=Saccostrea cuccullata TaxID=36930 RepID=UPI002ED12AC7